MVLFRVPIYFVLIPSFVRISVHLLQFVRGIRFRQFVKAAVGRNAFRKNIHTEMLIQDFHQAVDLGFLYDGVIVFDIGKGKTEFCVVQTYAVFFHIKDRSGESHRFLDQSGLRSGFGIEKDKGRRLRDLLHAEIALFVVGFKVVIKNDVVIFGL